VRSLFEPRGPTLGAIREVSIFDRGQIVAEPHREFRAEGRDTLVVATTHAEISQLTDAIRLDRKEHGELGVGHSFHRYGSLQWTRAQKQELSNYQEGQDSAVFTKTRNLQNDMSLWKSYALVRNLWLLEKRPEAR
jgi:hypothetical protein